MRVQFLRFCIYALLRLLLVVIARTRVFGARWAEVQLSHATHDVALVLVELVLEARLIQHSLLLFGWECAQGTERLRHCFTAIVPQPAELLEEPTGAISFIRSEAIKAIHTLQHALLLLRRQAVEPLKPVHETLLHVWRKLLELGVALKRLSLFLRTHVHVVTQPIAAVRTVGIVTARTLIVSLITGVLIPAVLVALISLIPLIPVALTVSPSESTRSVLPDARRV